MNFKTWWLANHDQIVKIGNFWLLPRKFKAIIRGIVAGIDAYIEQDSTAFVNVAAPQDLA